MKINRLVEIIVILLNREKITSKALAERFDVSVRTIYRDIEVLSSAGVPIYMNRGQGGGISLLDSYTLNKVMLSNEEKENLLLALKTLGATKQVAVESTLEKLGGLFGQGLDNYIEVDFNWWGADTSMDTRFNTIKEAILKAREIKFVYINTKNEKSLRNAKPYKIFYKGQAWYLKAYCLQKEAFRIFKITRMSQIELLSNTFNRDEFEVLLVNEEQPNYKLIELRLKFKNHMLYRIVDYYQNEEVIEDIEGNYIVNLRCPYDEWIYAHILSYGEGVEVLEPKWLRDEVGKRVRNISEKYM